jgi:hypothetical protein
MAIERSVKFFGIPVPFTKKEILWGSSVALKANHVSVGMHSVPTSRKVELKVLSEDEILVENLKTGEMKYHEGQDINRARIKSEWIALGVRTVYRYKPSK